MCTNLQNHFPQKPTKRLARNFPTVHCGALYCQVNGYRRNADLCEKTSEKCLVGRMTWQENGFGQMTRNNFPIFVGIY